MAGFLDTLTNFATGGLSSLVDFGLNQAAVHQEQRWQEHLFRQRHQIEVADLKAAGLNPALSVMSPLGGMPAGVTPGRSNIAQGVNSAMAVANQAALVDSQADLNKALAEKARAEAGSVPSQIAVNEALQKKYIAGATLDYSSAAEAEAHKRVLQETLPKLAAEVKSISQATQESEAREALARAEALLKGLDARQMQALMPFIVDTARSEAIIKELGIAPASAMSEAAKTAFGKLAAQFKGLGNTQILAAALRLFFSEALTEEK